MEPVTVHCPGCRLERRPVGEYLCRPCWADLPEATKGRLHDRTQSHADAYRQLLEHCRDRKPMRELVLA